MRPRLAIEGGRVSLFGAGFSTELPTLPAVTVDGTAARVVFASPSRLDVIVPAIRSEGPSSVRVAAVDGEATLGVGAVVATGLHQVDSPVIDASGNCFVTYSGTRGQQVPVSVFRVGANGTREAYSSAIVNPTSMTLDHEGRLFVSSRFEGTVYRVLPDGTAESFATDLGVACGLAFSSDGTLFVGDRSGTIFAVDRHGHARRFVTLPPSVAAFHLAIGANALFVTGPTLSPSDSVYRIDFDGHIEVVTREFGRPQGLAVASDGTLYVVDALAGASGLYRVAEDGSSRLVVAAPGLIGVTFDPRGGMIVCTTETAYRLPRPA